MPLFLRTIATLSLMLIVVTGHAAADPPKTRREFARAMAKVTEGMSEKDVLAILGMPDDIQTQSDPGCLTECYREVWRYGTDGHLTFPTLGVVYIGNRGKARDMSGGFGEPPDPKYLPEEALRPLLQLIDKAPSYSSSEYDPRRLIQIVNTLHPLGKEKSLAVLEEYLRVSLRCGRGRDGVFLVLRVLFDVPVETGSMPVMNVGAFMPSIPDPPRLPRLLRALVDFPANPELMPAKVMEAFDPSVHVGDRRLPRYPIVIEEDVPFLLVDGYSLQGVAERPESHLKYFKEKGQFRKNPLAPTHTPTRLMASTTKKLRWFGDDRTWKLLVGNQILTMLDSVHRKERSGCGCRFWAEDSAEADKTWKPVEAEIAKIDIRWNREQNRYTFKDGSYLPAASP